MLGKRTDKQVAKSVKEGDYTGGYNFFYWLIWQRFSWLGALVFGLIIFGAGLYFDVPVIYIGVASLFLVVFVLQVNDYIKLKNKINS